MQREYFTPNMIYDYIIIGTGPAGSVLAKALSDNRINSVLVLEAGENNIYETPIQTPSTETWHYYPNYFWQGRTILQEQAGGRMFNWTTGRTLGGGSSVNSGQYVRPTPSNLKQWERICGRMWSPEQAISYYIQMEKFNGKTEHPEVHGYSGRLSIRQAPVDIPSLTEKLVAAIEQASGYPTILDYNDPSTTIGPFHRWQLFQQPNSLRESAATAFLSPDIISQDGYGVNQRKLRIFFKATALRIIINDNKEAVGVEFLKDGHSYGAYARKKVIICAGINSSQLLLLSGIGPSNQLGEAGIPVVFHNPNVGQNMVTHPLYSATFTLNPNDLAGLSIDPYALFTGGAFLPYPDSETPGERGIQMVGQVRGNTLQLMIINLNPNGRGSITIQNNDPLKIVLPNYGLLTNPIDLEVMKKVFRDYVLPIAENLAAIDPSYQLVTPTPEIIGNDDLLESFLRRNIDITYHEQSFNRMAPLHLGGVVDQYGSVYGVTRLIIADSSIIPYTIDANNAAGSYLIGYTLARQLLQNEAIPVPYPYPFYPPFYSTFGY